MYVIDHAHDEPRWAGFVRIAAAGVFAVLVTGIAVVDVSLMSMNEQAVEAATTPIVNLCGDPSARVCRSSAQQ